jgi:hypothetical protein
MFVTANGKAVSEIAYIINDDIITHYDIKQKAKLDKTSINQATSKLIEEILFKQELKKFNIKISDDDLNEQIKIIAKNNNMNFNSFMRIINTNVQYFSFIDDLKQKLSRQKLINIVSRGNIARATSSDLKIYYNNNKRKFLNVISISGVLYSSTNDQALLAQISNPISQQRGVRKQSINLNLKSINNPQLRYLISNTDKNSFTQIYQNKNSFNSLYISNKKYSGTTSFKKVKAQIFEIVMSERQKSFLKDYFSSLEIKANIKKL